MQRKSKLESRGGVEVLLEVCSREGGSNSVDTLGLALESRVLHWSRVAANQAGANLASSMHGLQHIGRCLYNTFAGINDETFRGGRE